MPSFSFSHGNLDKLCASRLLLSQRINKGGVIPLLEGCKYFWNKNSELSSVHAEETKFAAIFSI